MSSNGKRSGRKIGGCKGTGYRTGAYHRSGTTNSGYAVRRRLFGPVRRHIPPARSTVQFVPHEPAVQRTIEQLDLRARRELDVLRCRQVRRDDPRVVAGPTLLQRVTDGFVERVDVLVLVHALAIGRVHDQDRLADRAMSDDRGWFEVSERAVLDRDGVLEFRFVDVGDRLARDVR